MVKKLGRKPEDYQKYVNTRFGRLTVKQVIGKDKHSIVRVSVSCDCGVEKEVRLSDLKSGRTISCGCNRNNNNSRRLKVHGGTGTRLYDIWCSMKSRCLSSSDSNYKKYGGRGIKICKEWLDFSMFKRWAGKHGYAEDLSIDRIDNDKGYSPDNCRWADVYTQANNKRRSVKITHNGRTLSISEWSRELSVNVKMIHDRIFKLGWTDSKALSTPVRKMRKAEIQP